MAPEGGRRDGQGVVNRDENEKYRLAGLFDRLARLEVKMDASADDRGKIHVRLDEVETNLSGQIKVQAERTAYMDILKWVAALILTAVGGYFFHALTAHVEQNTQAIEQHQSTPDHAR